MAPGTYNEHRMPGYMQCLFYVFSRHFIPYDGVCVHPKFFVYSSGEIWYKHSLIYRPRNAYHYFFGSRVQSKTHHISDIGTL